MGVFIDIGHHMQLQLAIAGNDLADIVQGGPIGLVTPVYSQLAQSVFTAGEAVRPDL